MPGQANLPLQEQEQAEEQEAVVAHELVELHTEGLSLGFVFEKICCSVQVAVIEIEYFVPSSLCFEWMQVPAWTAKSTD